MDANQQNIYINTPVVPAGSQQGQGQEQTQASTQPAFANAAETQGGGLQELLEALRHALKDDSQTSAFKQFSHVQEYSRPHEIPRPVSRPVPHVMPGVIRQPQYTAQSRHCTVNDAGCLWGSSNPNVTSWQREIARLETTESAFLCCCLVLGFLIFVSKQITFTSEAPLDEYGAKKKRSKGSS